LQEKFYRGSEHREWLAAAGRSHGPYAVSTHHSKRQPKTRHCNLVRLLWWSLPCRGRNKLKKPLSGGGGCTRICL
jgi:hypothetical protein